VTYEPPKTRLKKDLTNKRLNARLNTQNERRLDKGASQKTATALGLATHYYKSVDSDVRLNDPLKERTIEETR
jgi:hypothetical protein